MAAEGNLERSFTIMGGDFTNAGEVSSKIKKILQDLRGVIAKAPQDAEVRMGMHLNYSKRSSPSPSHIDAEGGPKVSYQPRQVGNDMGLWVMGTGWMTLVEEIVPEPGEEPQHSDESHWWIADGLAYAVLGNSRASLAAFDRALQRNSHDELALLGRAVAFVEMGEEKEAIAAYRHLLELYPKNRVAKDGLAWLLREPAK